MQHDDEAALVALAAGREDREAFGLLVRRYQSPLRDFLRKMTRGDHHLADDLAQETFVRAWQRLPEFRAEARFSTWLFGIAFNNFRASWRKGASARATRTEEPRTPAPDPASGAPGLRLDLAEALAALEEPERAAVLLCCQEGWSHEEAAQALGCPLGTVKTHVLRGRKKLMKLLER